MEDPSSQPIKPIQRSLLLPLLGVLVLLVAGFGVALQAQHRQHLERATIERGEVFTELLQRLIRDRSAALTDTLRGFTRRNPQLAEQLTSAEREYLLELYRPQFLALQDALGVSHFYFHSADGRNLLRLHKPDTFGDTIDRQTLRAAVEGESVVVGVELGPMGSTALRAVERVETSEGEVAGYVELGVELGALLAVLQRDHDADFVVTTHKEDLRREPWESGLETLDGGSQWDQFRNVVVSYESRPGLGGRIAAVIESGGGTHQDKEGSKVDYLDIDGRTLIALTYPLEDLTGTRRGDVIALRDVTAATADMRQVGVMAFLFAGLLSAVLVGFLFVALRRVDRGIQAQQAALLRSQERFALAMSVANDGIWDWDLTNDVLSLDDRCYTMLGYEVGAFAPRYDVWGQYVHPEDLPGLQAAVKEYLNDRRETFDAEFRFLHADGEYRWLRSTGKVVARDTEGKPARLVGTHSHIDKRKRAEAERERAAAMLGKRNRVLESLNRLGRDLTLANSIEEIGKYTVSVLREQDGAPLVGIYLLDATGDYLELSYYDSLRLDPKLFAAAARIPVKGSFNGLALQNGEILHCSDFANDDRINPDLQKAFAEAGARAETILPLMARGRPMGTIAIVYPESEDYTEEDRWAHSAVAQTVAIAIENLTNIEELGFQARHDSLTGLPNRLSLHDYVGNIIDSADSGFSMLMILMDLNRFKDVNDTLGHHIGDELLRALAERLAPVIEAEGGRLFRLGGDEFAVVVLRPAEEAAAVAEAIEAQLRCPVTIRGLNLEMDCSCGMAIYPRHGSDSHELLRCSDIAMYQAKERMEAFRIYEEDLDDKNPRRLELLSEFRTALENGTLDLYFQPRITLGSNSMHSCEALLRWKVDDRKFIPPSVFIPLVETTDLIHPLTFWVLRRALSQAKAWMECGLDVVISVNVSGRNLINMDFPARVAGILEEVGVPGDKLQIEITETALVTDPERALQVLRALSKLGISIAIDDFGTGYSSLSYLKQLPLNALKVDASFVKDMLRRDQDAAIVQSTISLAHSLGLLVVAEGVEVPDVATRLRQMNCDEAQGFFFSEPLPCAAFEEWLRKRTSA